MPFYLAAFAALALAYAGMAALSLAMARHHQQLLRREASPVRRRCLRALGALALLLALLPCVVAWGASVGVVVWLGFLSMGALLLALMLSYAPRLALWSTLAAAPALLVLALH